MVVLVCDCIFLLLLQLVGCCDGQASPLNIVIVSSIQDKEDKITSWTHGRDIAHSAIRAVEDITKNYTIMQQYELVPVPILVPECDPLESIDKYFCSLVNSSTEVVAVVGMFCDAVAESFSPIISHLPNSNVLHISGSSLRYKDMLPHHQVFHMVPSHEDAADGIVRVLLSFNWTRIGIVCAQTGHGNYANSNYLEAAEALTTVIGTRYYYNFTIPFKSELQGASSSEIDSFLRHLNSSQVNIVVVFIPVNIATAILKQATEIGLVWPRLSWIFVHLDPALIGSFLPPWWEDAIFISYSSSAFNSSMESNATVVSLFESLVYDSIWKIALVLNDSLVSSAEYLFCENCTNGKRDKMPKGNAHHLINKELIVMQYRINLVVRFVRNQKAEIVGRYDFAMQSISVNRTLLEPVPPDKFQVALWRLPAPVVIVLSLWLALVYIVSIANVALFVFFRKEREIKATSVSLSSWIFLGSFLMLVSSTIRVAEGGVNTSINQFYDRYITCNLVVMIGVTGFDLIVATTLVKTLRIWHIFRHFGKLGKGWSDLRLGAIIFVLIFVQILIFVLWISIDTYHLVETISFQSQADPPFYMSIHTCYSNYSAIWSAAGITYTLILLSFLIVLAIKTRTIHRKDFKDTKKILFVVITQQVTLIAMSVLWITLQESTYAGVVYSLLELSLSVTALVIHISLFSPKVLPPLHRYCKGSLQSSKTAKSKKISGSR